MVRPLDPHVCTKQKRMCRLVYCYLHYFFFTVLHLQTSNEVLQKTIREEKEIKTRLAAEVQFLMEQIHKMKVERAKAISEVSEKVGQNSIALIKTYYKTYVNSHSQKYQKWFSRPIIVKCRSKVLQNAPSLTHISLAAFLWNISKKCKTRSDTTKRGV